MNLSEFFTENPQAAIAFSGGVDSAYLLYAALQCRAEVRAYYVKSVFQPQFELDDGIRLAKELGADLRILEADVLTLEAVASNVVTTVRRSSLKRSAKRHGQMVFPFCWTVRTRLTKKETGPVCGRFESCRYSRRSGFAG